MEALPDTGLFLVGYTLSYGLVEYDISIYRLNKNNALVWSRRLGGAYYDQAYASALTNDGGLVVAGIYGTTPFNSDPYIAKISGAGALVWTRVLTNPGFDRLNSIERTPDNGFIVSGNVGTSTGPDAFIAKLTSTGVLSWQRAINGTSTDDGYGAIATLDGGYMLSGSTYSWGAGSQDAFLCKLNASGVVQWMKTYGNAMNNLAVGVVQTPDSGYTMAGTTANGFAINDNVFLVRTDKNGNLINSKEYGAPAPGLEWARALKRAPDGGFLVAGTVWECPTTDYEVLLLKTLPNGYCPTCDTVNVAYTTATITPPTSMPMGSSTGGSVNTIVPMMQSDASNMHLCSDPLVLPIELLSFTGKATGAWNELHWTTASELNNDHFELERSDDGVTWQTLATAPGAGTSQQTITYSEVDRAPYPLTYYRLKQVDFDGTSSLIGVVALQHACSEGELILRPDPSGGTLNVSWPGDAVYSEAVVLGTDGRVISRLTVAPDAHGTLLNIRNLSAGFYLVALRSNSTAVTRSWVKAER